MNVIYNSLFLPLCSIFFIYKNCNCKILRIATILINVNKSCILNEVKQFYPLF